MGYMFLVGFDGLVGIHHHQCRTTLATKRHLSDLTNLVLDQCRQSRSCCGFGFCCWHCRCCCKERELRSLSLFSPLFYIWRFKTQWLGFTREFWEIGPWYKPIIEYLGSPPSLIMHPWNHRITLGLTCRLVVILGRWVYKIDGRYFCPCDYAIESNVLAIYTQPAHAGSYQLITNDLTFILSPIKSKVNHHRTFWYSGSPLACHPCNRCICGHK